MFTTHPIFSRRAEAIRRSLACVVCSAVLALCTLFTTRAANAQEVVSGEVWLGGQLFTTEDLDTLTKACGLSDDERDAAQEIMRGALVRARTMSLGWHRDWEKRNDMAQESDNDDWTQRMKVYRQQMTDHLKEVVDIERSVMNDLSSLLSEDQRNRGWKAFERSRRRLLLRDAEGEGVDVDVVAMVQATKLPPEDVGALAILLEQYETALDAMVAEQRPLMKQFSGGPMAWYRYGEQTNESDYEKYQDVMKRIRQLHVRTARQVEGQLSGQLLENFQRQRLRIESRWEWKPMLKWNQVAAIMRLRSLTTEQKDTIKQLALDADRALLKKAIEERHRRDADILLDKSEQEADEEQTRKDRRERRLVREKLLADIVELLTPEQKLAFESGLENEQDLSSAFDRKRYGTESWEVDRDLFPALEEARAEDDEP